MPEIFARGRRANIFTAANKLYAEGKFAEAAKAYEKILADRRASPALLFNYGNAEFKSGNLGQAIAAYRRAELLAPRDAEIRANLDFVRNQVQGATVRESRWQNWLGNLYAERMGGAHGDFVLADVCVARGADKFVPRLRRN